MQIFSFPLFFANWSNNQFVSTGKCMEGIQFGVFDASIEHRLDWKRSITEQESAK